MNNKLIDLKLHKKAMINTVRDNKILHTNKFSKQKKATIPKTNFS